MNKQRYIEPQITIVDFKVEHCFDSFPQIGTQQEHVMSRFLQGDQYATGETYTSYTDEVGEYQRGTW